MDLIARGARRVQRFGGKRGEGKRGNNRTEEENFSIHILILSLLRHRFIAMPMFLNTPANHKTLSIIQDAAI